ncbi:MAG TPA: hypothetical protein VIK50_08435 [Gemmatimonadaceae bacterium]
MRNSNAVLAVAAIITGLSSGACGTETERIAGPDVMMARVLSAVTPSVTGSGQYVLDGMLRTFAFTVRTMPDGSVRGRFSGATHQPLISWSGRLDCLVVDGNTAWIGGVYEHATNPSLVGVGFAFKAVDNGEGASADPDYMSRAMRGGTDCNTRPEPNPLYFYEIFGNIQIHQ